jgi:uncharacterized protein YwqG
MVNPDDRRRFFKELLAEAAENAKAAHVTLGPLSPLNKLERLASFGMPADDAVDDRPAWMDRATIRARSAQRTCSLDDLVRLAETEGLHARVDAIRDLARHSVRLTHRAVGAFGAVGHSRLGGEPDLPEGMRWPTWQGLQLEFLGQIDLGEVWFPGAEDELPTGGLLLFFFDADGTATGRTPEDQGAARAYLVPTPPPRDQDEDSLADDLGSPIDLTVELVLPRAKSAPVRALGLTPEERRAWRALRLSLARAQGVGPEGDGTVIPAVHRFLGYADETTGDMPLTAELVARGFDLTDEEGAGDAPTESDRAAADPSRWRLLLQLSVDDELDPCWADFHDRLYLWTDTATLLDGALTSVAGFPR